MLTMRCLRSSIGVPRPPLARTSKCIRFLIVFFSGTIWNRMRGPRAGRCRYPRGALGPVGAAPAGSGVPVSSGKDTRATTT